MTAKHALSESAQRLLAELGFAPLADIGPPAWRASREDHNLVAVLHDMTQGGGSVLMLTAGAKGPIDAFLRVEPRGVGGLAGPFKLESAGVMVLARPTHTTDDPTFDARFDVFCFAGGVEVVSAMLDAPVRRALLELPERVRPLLEGASVSVIVPVGDPAEETALLTRCVPTLWALNLALEDAARAMPVAPPLRPVFDAFARAAGEHGMTLRRNALSASKRVGRVELNVTLHSAKNPLERIHLSMPPVGVSMRVFSEAGLPGRPTMRAAGVGERLLRTLVAGGARTGDEAFDRAWTFDASDPDAARRWLTPEVRAALGALREAGMTVTVDAHGIDVKGPLPLSDAQMPSLLPHLEALARSMDFAASPFR